MKSGWSFRICIKNVYRRATERMDRILESDDQKNAFSHWSVKYKYTTLYNIL